MVLEAFHPTVRGWFAENVGEPTRAQREGWPAIGAGENVLIAAPTGSGKTFAAFLWALDRLLRRGDELLERTEVLYISPLKALSNDVAKNLIGPLGELMERDPALPAVRVAVRTGDTPQKDRQAMTRRPPHVLVTTPESLYILLTSDGGRRMLKSVRSVIVEEIHALARDKRGSHLSLSLERLDALVTSAEGAPEVQRIGLSATQRPIEEIARFLGGVGRDVRVVDAGHLRKFDLGVEVPPSPLSAVCSHEVWEEIYDRMTELIREHRTTLIFVGTRKMAERLSARLADRLGEEKVKCHHGSLSREIRLDAEQRLKAGKLQALVATASLELGIDIGDIDLVCQVGAVRAIATFLQRIGRAGHGVGRVPKGRVFPLTLDELAEAGAILGAIKDGELDRIHPPEKPLDVLAQQIVATCVPGEQDERELFAALTRAWPYRDLSEEEFFATAEVHLGGRYALLHRDGVNGRLIATRRARMRAIQSGGAIPDSGDYRVILEPDGVFVGTLNEDFSIEANAGDIFQLGTTSWRILRVEMGTVRVADAKGLPPTLPFWLGEGPGRTEELSGAIGDLREAATSVDAVRARTGFEDAAARQLTEFLDESRAVLGALPTPHRMVCERFFDEAGGTQIVLHAPFGARVNRALGLALRKRICRGFGFELQAAANEEAILFSLGEKPGVPVDQIFDWLHPRTAREVLTQALLVTPMFEARWRWNATRALLVDRMKGGKPVPILLQKMRAQDELTEAFPQAVACPETLATPDIEVPMDHPLVRQTIEDCLHEAMDIDGMIRVLEGLRDGSIEGIVVDTPRPSTLAHGILAAGPYAFLDDAPLEERRARAVETRRSLDDRAADTVGALDDDAVARVKDEAWPDPRDAEEVHEALGWMGFVTDQEAVGWGEWLGELHAAGRVVREGDRWFAVEATRDPTEVLRGRMEALGPVIPADADTVEMAALEADGAVMRVRHRSVEMWCNRRLLKRIQRYTVDRLRKEIEPATATQFLRFLACWQHAASPFRLEGPEGVRTVLTKLAGFEAPARTWERDILPLRVQGYRREWLDEVTLSGSFSWGRLFGAGMSPIKTTPLALVPREDLDRWLALASPLDEAELSGDGRAALEILRARGAVFPDELKSRANLLPEPFERVVQELIGHGLLTADSFSAIRSLLLPPSRRRNGMRTVGRFSAFRGEVEPSDHMENVEFVARRLLDRTGVVFRKTARRERLPIPWRDLVRFYRRLELRGEVRGGRFVAGFDGEQYALPEAVDLLRSIRRREEFPPIEVAAADPLNYQGILTPDKRPAPTATAPVWLA